MLPGGGSYPHCAFTSALVLPDARVTHDTCVQHPAVALSLGWPLTPRCEVWLGLRWHRLLRAERVSQLPAEAFGLWAAVQ